MLLTVDWHIGLAGCSGDRVEDHSADAVNTHRWGANLWSNCMCTLLFSFVAKLVIHLCFYEERLKMSIRQWNCTWNDIWKLTWTLGSFELVAHGIVIQSVVHEVPTTDPTAGLPPVMLNDMAGVFTKMKLLIYHVAIFEVFLSMAFSMESEVFKLKDFQER